MSNPLFAYYATQPPAWREYEALRAEARERGLPVIQVECEHLQAKHERLQADTARVNALVAQGPHRLAQGPVWVGSACRNSLHGPGTAACRCDARRDAEQRAQHRAPSQALRAARDQEEKHHHGKQETRERPADAAHPGQRPRFKNAGIEAAADPRTGQEPAIADGAAVRLPAHPLGPLRTGCSRAVLAPSCAHWRSIDPRGGWRVCWCLVPRTSASCSRPLCVVSIRRTPRLRRRPR
jgi:hypothetical protein